MFYEALLRQVMSQVIEKVNQSDVEKLKQELSIMYLRMTYAKT